jgi:NAD-reducing hydrogenase large subunit
MGEKITIEPVTRIEGHAKITLDVADDGRVADAKFHVVEFRGFEKFVEGRHFTEMPTVTSRICGICPVSHHLAAAKAGDALVGATPPRSATLLRRLMHKGQLIQSHALSFFHLSSPDFLIGWDADPAKRNILGLVAEKPEVAKRGIALRRFGQEIIEAVGGRKIHPEVCVPGGMSRRLSTEDRDRLRAGIDEALGHAAFGLDLLKQYVEDHRQEVESFAVFPSKYLSLVTPDGGLEVYDGLLRIVDENGTPLETGWDPADYLGLIGEVTEDWSYLKFPFYRPDGYPEGSYRVGPLARLNVADEVPTPRAAKEWEIWRGLASGRPVGGSMFYHWARLIEILFCLERAADLLDDPDITASDLIATTDRVHEEGVGVIEAPRGTLIHHYWANPDGSVARANLIVATGHNNYAMNRAILDVARQYVDGTHVEEGMLNRVEAAIRCYDPCLSCSTHAIGRMPLVVELRGPDGTLLETVSRGVKR